MNDKTKNLLKIAGGVLFYYGAARQSHEQLRRGAVVETPGGPELRPFSKFEMGLRGASRFLWGYLANDGLRGLGLSDGAALSWTMVGAWTVEWYVLTNKTKFVKLPRPLPPPAVGWDHEVRDPHAPYSWEDWR